MGELPPAIHYAYMEQDRDRNPAKRLELTADELSNLKRSPLEGIVLAQNDRYAQRDAHGAIDYKALADRAEEIGCERNPDEAIKLLEPHKNKPDNKNADFYNNLGLAYASKGRLNEAIVLYEKSLKLEPDDPITLYNLGVTLYDLNRLNESYDKFSKVVELNPSHKKAKDWKVYIGKKLRINR